MENIILLTEFQISVPSFGFLSVIQVIGTFLEILVPIIFTRTHLEIYSIVLTHMGGLKRVLHLL